MDSQSTPQQDLEQEESFVLKVNKKYGVRRILTALIDPSYSGGSPKIILDVEDDGAAAADEQLPIIIPFAHTNVRPSGMVAVVEVAQNEFVILGEIGHLPVGDLREGACWTAITPGSIASSATAITSRAQRFYNDQDLLVSSVNFVITTGGSGLVARVKLYSGDGTLVIDTNDVNCDSSGNKSASISPAIRITPGTYIVEVTASATVAWRCMDLAANIAAVMNIGTTQRATSHTMGTPTTAVEFPCIKFQS